MSEIEEAAHAPEAAIVASEARRAAIRAVDVEGGLPRHVATELLRSDERIAREDLEHLADRPREARGSAVVHDGPSFVAYVNRHAAAATTMWADPAANSGNGVVVAVVDDHLPGEPGWREHRVELRAQLDPDFADWVGIDGRLHSQKAFAQFLLDHDHTIVDPTPNRLMPAILQFTAARNAQYESSVDLDNGQVGLVYVEEIKTQNPKGRQRVALPQEITLALFPYAGAVEGLQAWQVKARLRWQIPADGGALQIGVKLIRPDQVKREGWERMCADIASGVQTAVPAREGGHAPVPMLQGVAPGPLRNIPVK